MRVLIGTHLDLSEGGATLGEDFAVLSEKVTDYGPA